MKIYLWRHSNLYSSWSMFDEPQIYKKRYTSAEVSVLASSKQEALQLLEKSGNWDVDELRRIEPEIIAIDEARIITKHVTF